MILKSSKKYKKVKYKFCEAKSAFTEAVKILENPDVKPIKFNIKFYKKTKKDFARLKVKVTQGKVFGPQPFLAIQTKKNRFMHDNFDFSENTNTWHYAFHADTISIEDVLKIGVAANDKLGNTCIKKISFKN